MTKTRSWARRATFALLSVPVTVALLGMCLVGRRRTAARCERWLLRLGTDADAVPRGDLSGRGLAAYAIACLPCALVSLLTAYVALATLVVNIGYPFRQSLSDLGHPFSASADLGSSWGGPSLAGAWGFHLAVMAIVLAGCVWLLGRLADLRKRTFIRRVMA